MITNNDVLNVLRDVDTTTLVNGAHVIHDGTASALETYCWINRLSKVLKAASKAIVVKANKDFSCMKLVSDKNTGWDVGGFCTLSNATKNGSWTFTTELTKVIDDAAKQVKDFKDSNKKTNYAAGRLDPSKDSMFAVTLNK